MQPFTHRGHRQLCHIGQLILGQRAACDRQGRQHRPGSIAAATGPRGQQLGQPGRNRGGSARPVPRLAGQGRGRKLLGEERVSLAAGVQLVGQLSQRGPARHGGDLLDHLIARQRAQPDLLHPRAAPRMRQPPGHLRTQRHFVAAAGSHDRHAIAAASPGHEGQEIQGRAVSPLHIIDHQRQPGLPGDRPQQLSHPSEQAFPPPPARALALFRPGRSQFRQQSRRFRADIRRCRVKRVPDQHTAVEPGQRIQRPGHRQQRQLLVQRQASPPRGQQPGRHGPLQPFPHEPRLASASVPHHQQEPRILVQRRPQARQFALTADKTARTGHALPNAGKRPPASASPGGSTPLAPAR